MAKATALLVDDDAGLREALRTFLTSEDLEVHTEGTLGGAREALERADFDLLIADLRLPDGTALELFSQLERPTMEVVLITAHGTVDTAVEAFRGGAIDYLTKPLDMKRLQRIVANVRRAAQLRSQVDALRAELRELGRFGRLIGASAPMHELYDQLLKVARTDATVFLLGETGTGKERVAETLHQLSARSEGPFLPLNCGSISGSLIESELFGHERGSFTGAVARHQGVFERASGGTLFLDEVTEMPRELQVKLLRALETQELHRVGGSDPVRVNVRVIAATNRDPKVAVAEGLFREDLLYRLNVFPIELPPLRDRGEDCELLADHVLARLNRKQRTHKQLTRAARQRLSLHHWPGNVRELEHAIERAFILSSEDIGPELLPMAFEPQGTDADGKLDVHVGMSIAEATRALTLATLEHYAEKKKAAEVLGVSVRTLYSRLNEYKAAHTEPSESG
jgi:DNA-binding NtrC family response regulator